MSDPLPRSWALGPAKPFARWSADTEQAFLLALRLTGRVRDAAQAIGRSTSAAYVRRRDAGFAARWDAVVAEQQAAWIAEQGKAARALAEAPLGDHRERYDGWSEARRKLFLRARSETGSVADACARARISTTSAWRLRQKCPRFAAAWEAALETQAVTLEQAAFERAVLGWEEPIVQGGKVIGQRWRFSASLLKSLLDAARAEAHAATMVRGKPANRKILVERAHAAARAAGGGFFANATTEETDAAILKKLDALARARTHRWSDD